MHGGVLAPPVRLERTTLRLTAACSTDWAKEEYDRSIATAGVGINLFSRAASSQVSSAPMSLTSVFGMGTGGTSSQSTPTMVTRAGIEPALPAWEAGVLAAWPTSHGAEIISFYI